MSRRIRSFLFDNINGKLLTDVAFTLKQITDEEQGTESVKTLVSNTEVKTAFSVVDNGGDGSLTYNDATGTITYTGPSSSEVRAHFSAGTGITITNGAIATTITQYSDSDARAAFSAGTGITIAAGEISTSITQYADSNARAAISVTDSGGDGSLSYNNTTGVITYTGPSASDVRGHFSAGTGITITSGAIAVDTSTIATKTYADNAATTAVATVIDSSAEALNTLNELATALGNDANFSTTVSTALGNRLRIDVNNQGLTNTQITNALTNLGITATTTELNYIDGVTSAIQTQLNAKAPTADPTFTGTVGLPSTTSIGNVSATELGYLDGVTSAIQTQLNAKAPTADPTFTGTVTLPSTTTIGNVSSTELGYLDGVSSAIQTQLNTKASTGKAIAMAIVFGG